MARQPTDRTGNPRGKEAPSTEAVNGLDATGAELDDVQTEDQIETTERQPVDVNDRNADKPEKNPAKIPTFVDPRAEMFKQIDARTHGQADEEEREGDEGEDLLEENEEPEDEATIINPGADKPEVAEAAAGDEPAEMADDAVVTMVVDGNKVRTTYGEMKARAQQYAASENRLDEANKILDDVRRRANEVLPNQQRQTEAPVSRDQANGGQPEARQTPTTQARQTNADPKKLATLMDRIQMGTPEEATAAFLEAIQEVNPANGQGGNAPADLEATVDAAIEQRMVVRGAQAEINEALNTAATKYPGINADDDLSRAAYVRAHEAAKAELKKIGVPDEDLASAPAMVLFDHYARFRQDARYRGKLKPMPEIFDGAAAAVAKKFNVAPAPDDGGESGQRRDVQRADQQQRPRITVSGDRIVRKTAVQQQPRSASSGSHLNGGQQQRPQVTSPSTVVDQMRAARGQ